VIITQWPLGPAAVASSLGLATLIVACAYISNPARGKGSLPPRLGDLVQAA
jgi:hypothetical protein